MDSFLFSLTAETGPCAGVDQFFTRCPVRIGRDWGNDLLVNDPGVGGKAAEIYREREDFFLGFSGSGQAVRLNDQPVTQATRLRQGDRIALGASVFRFQTGTAVDEAEAPAEAQSLIEKLKQLPPRQLLMGGLILLVVVGNVWLFSSKKKGDTPSEDQSARRTGASAKLSESVPLEKKYPEIFRLSAQEKAEQAQSSYNLGLELMRDEQIRNDNAAKAVAEFEKCLLALEAVEPKPELDAQARAGLESARRLLDAKFSEHRLELIKAIRLAEWETALSEVELIQEIIADRTDPRFVEAMVCAQDLDRCLKSKKCPESCFEGF